MTNLEKVLQQTSYEEEDLWCALTQQQKDKFKRFEGERWDGLMEYLSSEGLI